MCDKPTISDQNAVCRNCDMFKDCLCLIRGEAKLGDDIACYQIYDHYIGGK